MQSAADNYLVPIRFQSIVFAMQLVQCTLQFPVPVQESVAFATHFLCKMHRHLCVCMIR
jgi:hypothetical protein